MIVLALIFLVCWGLTTHGKYSASGDEPHYLMVTQSLWADHDLDLRNNYDENQGALFGASGLRPELHARVALDGELRPVHDVGTPLLLLPVYVAAQAVAALPSRALLHRFRMDRGLFAYSLVSLFIIAIVVSAAGATLSALVQSGISPRVGSFMTLAAWLTPPVLSNSFVVFPEAFALLLTAWVVHAYTAPTREWTWRDLALVLALGLLPWLHRKYAVYALVLLAIVMWHRRHVQAARRSMALATGLTAFALPQIALAVWTNSYWGNVAGPLGLERLPFSVGALENGLVGMLVDRENGLLWWAPVYALLPAAFALGRSGAALWLLPAAALLLPSAAHDQWWGGFSPADRFLMPLIPIFCIVGAILVRRSVACWIAAGLLVPQVLIAAYGWQHPRTLWPQGDGRSRAVAGLLVTAGLPEQWLPSFRTDSAGKWMAALVLIAVIAVLNWIVVISVRRNRDVTRETQR
jgi:hypothetical protein